MLGDPSGQQSLVLLAQHGLFLPGPDSLVTAASKRPYTIRNATETDLDRLILIEEESWKALRLPRERILARLRAFPDGQWICAVDGLVVGVIYTQVLESADALLQKDTCFANQESLNVSTAGGEGRVLQLLGVAVLPACAHMQIGLALRDFVHQLALAGRYFSEMVAMTRCSSPSSSAEEYVCRVAAAADPTIAFHASGGAQVVAAVAQYRPEDELNWGHAVLVKYELSVRGARSAGAIKAQEQLQEQEHVLDTVSLSTLRQLLQGSSGRDLSALGDAQLLQAPFMTLGLDSLAMTEVRGHLRGLLHTENAALQALSPTLLFDFPTAQQLIAELNRIAAPATSLTDVVCAGARAQSVAARAVGEGGSGGMDIAICGMSCRFPGGVDSPQVFFEALCGGLDATTAVPVALDWTDARTGHAALLSDAHAEEFDAAFFRLSAAEAQRMDPHQRLLLEVGHEALAEAGLLDQEGGGAAQGAAGARVGVFVGLCNNEWAAANSNGDGGLSPYCTTALSQSAAANRLSFLLGLTGPSLVVDTACSSSLAALHTALNAMRCGDCDSALVAAADLMLSSHSLKIREAAGMLSPGGKNRSFDVAADGYVRGEGAGAVVLKPLARAEADWAAGRGGPVLGVVRGSAMNQDGRSASFTAPNGSAQRELLRNALLSARLPPTGLAYVETHGTGTALGDPIEWGALRDVLLAQQASDSRPLVLGAVKSNVGHLEGAAGMAGLFKAVACLKNSLVPGNLHMHKRNSRMQALPGHREALFPHAPVSLLPPVEEGGSGPEAPLCAGVSCFGSGGTNVHVVLQRYCGPAAGPTPGGEGAPAQSRVAFLFTGQGLVYKHMGRQLFEAQPAFHQAMEQCCAALSLEPSLLEALYDSTVPEQVLQSPLYAQLGIVALEVALLALWRNQGVHPCAVAGHSLGEYAAAVAAGILDGPSAMRIVHARLLCLQEGEGDEQGAMVAVRVSEEAALQAVQEQLQSGAPSCVALAAVNGPRSVVLSGKLASLEGVLVRLSAPSHKFLVVDRAYHSPLLRPAAEAFQARLQGMLSAGEVHFLCPGLGAPPLVSCKTGVERVIGEMGCAEYWATQMLSPVRFQDCVRALRSLGAQVLLELGPHCTLASLAPACLSPGDAGCAILASLHQDQSSAVRFAATLAEVRGAGAQAIRCGGRRSPLYRAQPMLWRRRGPSGFTAAPTPAAESARGLLDVVRAAVEQVLLPEAVARLAEHTSLLSLGVDSLGSMAVRNALAKELSLPQLPSTLLLRHPSLRELTDHLATLLHFPNTPQPGMCGCANSSCRCGGEGGMCQCASWGCISSCTTNHDSDSDLEALEQGVEAEFPASSMQQAMIFHHVADPDAKSFVESFRWEAEGPLDEERYRLAWVKVVRQHACLRSSFDAFAVPSPLQRVWRADAVADLRTPAPRCAWFRSASLAHLPEGSAALEAAVEREVRVQRAWTCDLATPLLLRLCVLRLPGTEKRVVLLTIHHAIVDGFSMQLLLHSLGDFYAAGDQDGLGGATEGSAPSYEVFAEFERALVESTHSTGGNRRSACSSSGPGAHWSQLLQGWGGDSRSLLSLPLLRVDAADEQVIRASLCFVAKSLQLQQLCEAARAANVTLAALFHAAWGVVYAKLSGSEDIMYGNTSSGRSARMPGVLEVVGPVINTFPMRYPVQPLTPSLAFVQSVQEQLLANLEAENFPLAEIQKLSPQPGNLFSVVFDFQTSAWDHSLSCADHRVLLRKSSLLDRVGCPVSVRVIADVDAAELQLHATSEFVALGADALDSTLRSLLAVARGIAEGLGRAGSTVSNLLELVEPLAPAGREPTAPGLAPERMRDVPEQLPRVGDISGPLTLRVELPADQLPAFLRNCASAGCEPVIAVLGALLCAVRRFSATAETCVTLADAQCGPDGSLGGTTFFLALYGGCSLAQLLQCVQEARAGHSAQRGLGSIVLLQNYDTPVSALPAATMAALRPLQKLHASATSAPQTLALELLFPHGNVPAEVAVGVRKALQCALLALCSDLGSSAATHLDAVLPQAKPVPGIREDCALPEQLMHEGFARRAAVGSAAERGHPAVVHHTAAGGRAEASYEDLLGEVTRVSAALADTVTHAKQRSSGSGFTCVIAVVMEKGWEQVSAALAVHRLQCAYLPMDARLWPEQRIRQVLDLSEAVAVYTQQRLLESGTLSWMSGLDIPVVAVDGLLSAASALAVAQMDALPRASPDDLAYLIYTSGSTGVPKGVCCHHRGAMNTIEDLNSLFSIGAEDRVLALSSLSFDLSVYDIFGMLSCGGTVVMPNPSTVSPPDPSEWFELVVSEQVTVWNTVPAFMELLVSHVEYLGLRLPRSLRVIYMSGDWIPVTLPARIRAVSDREDIRIISMGGATEASIWSNMFELTSDGTGDSGIPEGWSSIPYGRPMRNQRMYVLNERMEHCEAWVTGSIFIGGAGVAHGYYKNPERTAYQFVRHPSTGESLFRTGDLGRVRPGGQIEILGREDSQVKVNGFRIELGEIERVLTQHGGVASAALAVHNNTLCAYLVLRSEVNQAPEEVFTALRADCMVHLADYMVPKHFMLIDEIPLSANGKVQRDRLPKFFHEAEGAVGMRTEKEEILAGVWASVLGINAASIPSDANFFSLGGDSLRSVQVVALAKKFGLLVSVSQVFSHPTVRQLAKAANSFRDLGPEVLGTSSESESHIFEVQARPEALLQEYPLIGINQAHFVGLHTSSYARNGMTPQIYFEWEIAQGAGGAEGQLDVAQFQTAIDRFVERHASFKSVVCKSGSMRMLEHVPAFRIQHVHAWDGDSASAEAAAARTRQEMMDNGPQVYEWPLFEVRVTHLQGCLSLVHVIVSLFLMDAMSDLILRQELSALYRAGDGCSVDDVLPPPSRLLFKDYCEALTTRLPQSDTYQQARAFWLARLEGLSSGPELPMLPPTEGVLLTGKFVNHHRWLSALEWRRAKKNCAVHSVTMPAVLLAAYSLVLYRWGSRDSFLINILQCLRHQVHADVNKMVGNCSSTILCDVDFSRPAGGELTFRLSVQRVAQELSQNLEHASMSGVEVMQELNRIKGSTFRAVAPFIFTTPIGVEKGNKQVESRDWVFQERFFSERVPHTACVNAIKADPSGTACASLDIVDGFFPPEVMQGMYCTYSAVLDVIVSSDPAAWNAPVSQWLQEAEPVPGIREDCALPEQLMHEGFARRAAVGSAAERGHPAVVHHTAAGGRAEASYEDLLGEVTRVSAALADTVTHAKQRSSGSGFTCVIAVVMEKGWEQVSAALAVHRLQCAYLPMDARLWPEQRIRQVLDLSEAVAVYTQQRLLESGTLSWMSGLDIPVVAVDGLLSAASALAVAQMDALPRASPDDLAYLIYTSGSTGVPKGVCCHHRGAMNTIEDLNSLFFIGAEDRVLALSSLSFDLSVYDIFGMLSCGGTVVMPDPSTVSPPDPSEWFELVVSEQVTVWNTVPAFMELLVSHVEYLGLRLPRSLRVIYMSGDWIPVTLPARIRAVSDREDIRIISMGGATEASIWSNMFELTSDGTGDSGIPEGWSSIPYGRPMRNQRMYVLNERMEHCEAWVTGSIFIGGAGVAHGYYKNPERTAYQFVRHPSTGESLFRTGDLGRVRPGGQIEILGREDSQVKVNGFRIELGEIERVLTQHGGVASAALAVHNNTLCAYLVLRSEVNQAPEEVFTALRADCMVHLADYMVPKHFMLIDEVPLSANGKVQRDKLPSPLQQLAQQSGSVADCVAPRTVVEAQVRAIVCKVLGVPEAGICCEHHTFFDLGGNSLSAIQLIFALRDRFGVSVGVQDLFNAPSVAGVSSLLGAGAAERGGALMEQLQLNEGRAGQVPIVLFNPAGASGLCYLPLVASMHSDRPVFVLDDGVMTSGRPFPFASIEEAAACCLPLVRNIAHNHGGGDVLLMGWSYGGVVASAVAKMFAMEKEVGAEDRDGGGEGAYVRVRALVMFDSSLRTPLVQPGKQAPVQRQPPQKDLAVAQAAITGGGDGDGEGERKGEGEGEGEGADRSSSEDLALLTQRHFDACTALLIQHHKRIPEQQPLTCPVLDVRPEQTDYDCGEGAAQELTSGPVTRSVVPGSHWTMLFDANVLSVAELLRSSV